MNIIDKSFSADLILITFFILNTEHRFNRLFLLISRPPIIVVSEVACLLNRTIVKEAEQAFSVTQSIMCRFARGTRKQYV